MSPEAQRLALAELDGYERCDPNPCLKSQWLGFKNRAWKCVPDYLRDLNAIHELEKLLYPPRLGQWTAYTDKLIEICKGTDQRPVSATAPQRAEALLRTLGKWKEDE